MANNNIVQEATKLADTPVVDTAIKTAAEGAAMSMGAPPGVGTAAVEMGKKVASKSAEKKDDTPAPSPNASSPGAPSPSPENSSSNQKDSDAKNYVDTNMTILEKYGPKLAKGTRADKLITGIPGAIKQIYTYMTRGADSAQPSSGLSSQATAALDQAKTSATTSTPEKLAESTSDLSNISMPR